jgi:transposase
MGAKRRVVVTLSPTFFDRQRWGFVQTLAKATAQLSELSKRLSRGRTRKSRRAVEAEIAEMLRPRWVSRVITWSLTGAKPANLRLRFEIDEEALQALEDEYFGKRILFTDRDDWPTTEVVAAYRAQAGVEAGFRQLKDPKVVSPIFHWTDQKVAVHAFYCVIALIAAHLMRREAERAGVKMSVRELLGTLGGIEETVLIYKGETGRPRARRMLTEMNATQKRLFDLFGLDVYAPKR